MLLAVPIAWSGNVEQYAGRLHRDYEGKENVIIYDYVYSHIKVLEKMYYKRLRAYKNIGYEIYNAVNDYKQIVNSIFDYKNYIGIFEKDIEEADNKIVISSPGLNKNKVIRFCRLVKEKQEKGVKVSILTLSSDIYPENRKAVTKDLINKLVENGICVKCTKSTHEHFAVIDKKIVWYGSMNLLSREKEDDNIMRIVSKEIADELLEIGFSNVDK